MEYFDALSGLLTIIAGIVILIVHSKKPKDNYQALQQTERLCPRGHTVAPGEKFCPTCGLMPDPESDTGLWTQSVDVPATPWQRILAWIIDSFVFGALVFVVFVLILGPIVSGLFELVTGNRVYLFELLAENSIFLSWALDAPYFILCWALWGTTVGKRALDLKLVAADGSRPSIIQAAVRWVVMTVLLFGAIAWWPLIWRKDNRGFHDLVAGTRVVKAIKVPASQALPRSPQKA